MRILVEPAAGPDLPVFDLHGGQFNPGVRLPGLKDSIAHVIRREGWIALKAGTTLWNVGLPLAKRGVRFGTAFSMRASLNPACVWFVECADTGTRMIEYDGLRHEERREIVVEARSQVRDVTENGFVMAGLGFYHLDPDGGGREPSEAGPAARIGQLAAYSRGFSGNLRIVNSASTATVDVPCPGIGWGTFPAFSPSGRWLAMDCVVGRGTELHERVDSYRVVIVDTTSGATRLSDGTTVGYPMGYVWSEDEREVALSVSYEDRGMRVLSVPDMHLERLRIARRLRPLINLRPGDVASP